LPESAICIMQRSHGIRFVQSMISNLPCIDSALLVSPSSILVPPVLSVISSPWVCSVHHHHLRGPACRKSRSGARFTLTSRRTCPRQPSNRPRGDFLSPRNKQAMFIHGSLPGVPLIRPKYLMHVISMPSQPAAPLPGDRKGLMLAFHDAGWGADMGGN
jgi:hypothetical protein